MIYQKIKVVGWKHKSKCSPSSTCHTTFTFNPKLSQNQTITHPGLYSHLLKPDIYSSTFFYNTHSFTAYHILLHYIHVDINSAPLHGKPNDFRINFSDYPYIFTFAPIILIYVWLHRQKLLSFSLYTDSQCNPL